jgi:hypothetical protein
VQAAAAAQVDARQRAGEGVEAGGQHQQVGPVLAPAAHHAVRRDALDRRAAHVHQRDVGAVVGVVVAGVDAQPLAADRVHRAQACGHRRVAHDGADLAAHELGARLVGAQVGQRVDEGPEQAEAADLPALLEQRLALGIGDRQRGQRVRRQLAAEAGAHAAVARAKARVVGLDARLALGVERSVARRHRVGRGALEHRQRARLLGDERDHLHARRAGAHQRDVAPAEVHRRVRPRGRMQHRAGERVEPVERRRVRRRQRADRHHDEACAPAAAVVAAHAPARRGFVEVRGADARVQHDVAAQLEAIGHVVGVAQQLGLRCVAFAPAPLLLQRLGERVRVLQALDVDARARVAIGPPGAAHARRRLEHAHGQPAGAQLVQRVQPAEAGADHQHVERVVVR